GDAAKPCHVLDGGPPGARQGRARGVGSQEQPPGRRGRRFDGWVGRPGGGCCMNKTVRTWFVVLAALAIVAAACGSDDTPSGESGGAIEPAKTYDSIGETEGSLELIAWAGYVEDGTS